MRKQKIVVRVATRSRGAGKYGQTDLAGNVWEWASDVDGAQRPTLGGGYLSNETALHSAAMTLSDPTSRLQGTVGIRCARSR